MGGLSLALRMFHHDEVDFSRWVFTGLVNGSQYIQDEVDWEQLNALGTNVGATYRQLPNAEEQAGFRQSFIARIAQGFRKEKGRAEDFINWRLQERGDGMVVVAADYPAKRKTLLLHVSTIGSKRLTGIQWQ